MAYGQLIDEAKRQLNRSLTAPTTLSTTAEALVVCDARARVYRVIAGGIALHLRHPPGKDAPQPNAGGGQGIQRPEAILLQHLRVDLLPSAATFSDAQPPQERTPGIAARLTRTADVAGAAFDLLAGHLTATDRTEALAAGPLGGDGIRVTARDAVQLARAMVHLDRRLELPIRSAAHAEDAETTRRTLLDAADDCNRTTQHGVGELATTVHDLLRAPARQAIDSLDIHNWHATPQVARVRPETGAAMVHKLLTAAHRQPVRLSVSDLAAIASVGARASALAAYACAPAGGPVGTALEAARQWRSLFHHLAPFTTPTPGRNLATYAHQFRAWADPLIRHRSPAGFTHPAWPTTLQTITTDLANLARAVTRAIVASLTARELLVPFDPHNRSRRHLYAAADASDARATQLRQTATATHHKARHLAVLLPGPGAPASRTPPLANRTPRPAPPTASAAATPTPPSPPQQRPRAPRR